MLQMSQIKDTASALGEEYGVENIYLFGSYARGDANEDSDVDFRIDKGAIRGLFKLAGLQVDLEDSLGKSVDLLTTDSLDDEFLNRIKSEEILLYAGK